MRARQLLGLLLWPLIILLVCGALIAAWFSGAAFERLYLKDQKKQLQTIAAIALAHLNAPAKPLFKQPAAATANHAALSRLAAALAPQNITLNLIRNDGEIVFGQAAAAGRPIGNRPEIRQAIKGQTAHQIEYPPPPKQPQLHLAVPVYTGQTISGALRLSAALAADGSGVKLLYRNFAVFTLGGIILLSLTMFCLTRRIARPLAEIKRYAQEYAQKRQAAKVAFCGIGEFDRIIHAFNLMASQINARLQTLDAERAERNLILESMRQGIIVLSAAGKIRYANSRAGKIFSGAVDLTPGALLHTVVREPQVHQLLEALEEATPADEPLEDLIKTYPAERQILARLFPYDQRQGALLVLNDVTRLMRLEKTRQEFVANVSHELLTPITAVVGFAETIIEMPDKNSEAAQKFLRILQADAQRLTRIVEDLLVLSKLDAGVQPAKETVVLRELINSAVDSNQAILAKREITLSVACPEAAQLACQPQMLTLALVNLINNAARYGKKGGRARLDVNATDSHYEITVADDGPGVALEERENIFNRFYRVDKSHSRATGGTGLGLAIVKHIAMLHRGAVSVRESELGGAAFCFRLPRQKQ